jgi:hypothetical protein
VDFVLESAGVAAVWNDDGVLCAAAVEERESAGCELEAGAGDFG